jgi:hypothetical protein
MLENITMGEINEKRGNQRYQTFVKVKIEGINKGDIQLKDISVTGCRVACTGCEELILNKKYKIEIIPERESEIGLFDLIAEVKWTHNGEIGFIIVESPKGKQFQCYVDYLSWR